MTPERYDSPFRLPDVLSPAAYHEPDTGNDEDEGEQGEERGGYPFPQRDSFAEDGFFRGIRVEVDFHRAGFLGLFVHGFREEETFFRYGVVISPVVDGYLGVVCSLLFACGIAFQPENLAGEGRGILCGADVVDSERAAAYGNDQNDES